MHWLSQNYQWLFDGVGGAVLLALIGWGYNRWKKSRTPACGSHFWLQFHPQGSRPLMIQNSGDQAGFDVVAKIPADGSGFTSDPINRLENDRSWVPCLSKGSFMHLEAMRRVLAETVLRGGDNLKTIPVLVSYRTQTQPNCECNLEIRLPLNNGIQFALPEK